MGRKPANDWRAPLPFPDELPFLAAVVALLGVAVALSFWAPWG